MRGAATAAQQRMANIGRSETPEATILHHHETRTSARRFGGPAREESPDPEKFILRLKVGRERLRKWNRELKAGTRPANLQQTPTFNRAQSSVGTPVPGAMGPPSTPGQQNTTLQPSTTPVPQGQIGRVEAPPPPAPGQPAHVPVSIFSCSIASADILARPSSMVNSRPCGSPKAVPQRPLRRRNALLRCQHRHRTPLRRASSRPTHPRRREIHVPASHPMPRLSWQTVYPWSGNHRGEF